MVEEQVGEVIGRGEIQLLNYSLNDVSSINLSVHFTQLLQLSRVQYEHGAQGVLLKLHGHISHGRQQAPWLVLCA